MGSEQNTNCHICLQIIEQVSHLQHIMECSFVNSDISCFNSLQFSQPKPRLQCESKIPTCDFLTFFPNGWEFLVQILHAYYAFLPTLNHMHIFVQLVATLTKLCHKRDHHHNARNVHHRPKRTLGGRT